LAACGASEVPPQIVEEAGTALPVGEAGTTMPSTDSGLPVPEAAAARDASQPAAIEILVEPSDSAAAIEGAKTSVHVTMYLFSSTTIRSALIAAKQKGRDVKVLLNQSFPGGARTNQAMFVALSAAGIDVRWTPTTFALTHEKCVILDTTSAWIMTMNATQSSPTDNREYLAIDHDPDDVAEAEAIFQADWASTPIVPNGKLVVAPTNAGPKLKALIDSATTTIDLEGEELSDPVTVSSLVARLDAGVKVRIVLADGSTSATQQSAVSTLKAKRAQVVSLTKPYMHAKALVVDGARAYVGSENFSAASLGRNRELGVMFTAPAGIATVTATIAADFAAGTAL
jgi:phosphatidylserine/phosphatidylglycerophosphate/cardiolipin synthase-like enzyme